MAENVAFVGHYMGIDSTVGDLVNTGATIAAFDELASASDDGHTHESACLNCGTALIGTHCHACGQHAHVHRTLGAFFHDLAHGVFHFEGRIWRTLPLLAWHPGRLTRRYIDGQRVRFVSPIAAFLFCAFVMFAALHTLEMPFHFNSGQTIDAALTHARAQAGELERKQALLATTKPDGTEDAAEELEDEREAVGEKLNKTRLDIARLLKLKDAGATTAPNLDDPNVKASDIEWINEAFNKARANPELLMFKMQANAHKYTWALIPLSVPLLWLCFPFSRRFGLYDHTVFVTYSLSFMMLWVSVLALAREFSAGLTTALVFIVPPWHMHRHLRETYGLTRWGALWRAGFLAFGAVMVLSTFAVLLVFMGMAE